MMSQVENVAFRWQEGNISAAMGDARGSPIYSIANDTDIIPDPGIIIFINVSQVLFPLMYFLLAVLGLVGNATVLFIIMCHPDMQTVTNYFIANLAVTDIFTLIMCTLPTALCNTGILPLVPAVCKAINYIQYVSKAKPDCFI